MSPLPHFPHWRPGLHPGAEGRGTGLDPHHHHRALHHPPHSQRKHGTWKGQRRHKDGMNDAGDGGTGRVSELKQPGQTYPSGYSDE